MVLLGHCQVIVTQYEKALVMLVILLVDVAWIAECLNPWALQAP
jgi:hypothetical protein